MAEWLCRGLQILVQRFDSASGLHLEAPASTRVRLENVNRPCVMLPALFGGSSAVEQSAVNRSVVGSIPTPRASMKRADLHGPPFCFARIISRRSKIPRETLSTMRDGMPM